MLHLYPQAARLKITLHLAAHGLVIALASRPPSHRPRLCVADEPIGKRGERIVDLQHIETLATLSDQQSCGGGLAGEENHTNNSILPFSRSSSGFLVPFHKDRVRIVGLRRIVCSFRLPDPISIWVESRRLEARHFAPTAYAKLAQHQRKSPNLLLPALSAYPVAGCLFFSL